MIEFLHNFFGLICILFLIFLVAWGAVATDRWFKTANLWGRFKQWRHEQRAKKSARKNH